MFVANISFHFMLLSKVDCLLLQYTIMLSGTIYVPNNSCRDMSPFTEGPIYSIVLNM